MAHKRRESTVEILCENTNFLSVVRERKLPPAVGNSLEQRDEAGGCCEYDVFRQCVFNQIRFFVQRCTQKLIARDEQDDEFGTVIELLPVRFRRQHTNMGTDVFCMPLQANFSVRVVLCFCGFEVSIERCFYIDNEFTLIGHAYDHIGTKNLTVLYRVYLLLKVTVFNHACQLNQTS